MWAQQCRAALRARLEAASELSRKLQDEVAERARGTERAEAELKRRTEEEFRRLQEVQRESVGYRKREGRGVSRLLLLREEARGWVLALDCLSGAAGEAPGAFG